MTKKKVRKELSLQQIASMKEAVKVSSPETIKFLIQKTLNAFKGSKEMFSFESDIEVSLEESSEVANLIMALEPHDVAELMLVCQFVVLHLKGMQEIYKHDSRTGISYLKLSQESFDLLSRYRGKAAQNINVTYNVLNSGKALLNTDLRQGVDGKIVAPHGEYV